MTTKSTKIYTHENKDAYGIKNTQCIYETRGASNQAKSPARFRNLEDYSEISRFLLRFQKFQKFQNFLKDLVVMQEFQDFIRILTLHFNNYHRAL